MSTEAREGIIFRGVILEANDLGIPHEVRQILEPDRECGIIIYIEGLDEDELSFGQITVRNQRSQTEMIDEVFRDFIDMCIFSEIPYPTLREALETYKRELADGVSWDKKTYRFVLANEEEKGTNEGTYFILTKDKSDITSREQQQAIAAANRILAANSESQRRAALIENRELIAGIARHALKERAIDPIDYQQLSDLNLLGNSTPFRSFELFPGESTIIGYSFEDEDGVTHSGRLGFDDKGSLISIQDDNLEDRNTYLGTQEPEYSSCW